ncbi:hypothetical protein F8388_014851 [Cannabis sativa]|uniref:RNase H type-1 domain-containing protein n=1 Tax=Cannabis sativa TaxID=3483 RepID=A0A7J6F5Z6_CANSA|nr:hypothetical protein F8388_014851 [Cannabis sativa]
MVKNVDNRSISSQIFDSLFSSTAPIFVESILVSSSPSMEGVEHTEPIDPEVECLGSISSIPCSRFGEGVGVSGETASFESVTLVIPPQRKSKHKQPTTVKLREKTSWKADQNRVKDREKTGWKAPPEGHCTINCDDALNKGRPGGSLGVIIQVSVGLLVAVGARYFCGCFTVLLAEGLAIQMGLELAQTLNIRNFAVASNSQTFINHLKATVVPCANWGVR